MSLIGELQQTVQETLAAAMLTDLAVGTVVSAAPLQISIKASMDPLQAPSLLLTSAVVEKTITNLGNSVCYENGQALPVEGTTVTVNRGLSAGDKVLLLRVERGQKFVVLSRVY